MDLKLNEFEYEDLNIGQGNDGDDVADLPMGMPRGNESNPEEILSHNPYRAGMYAKDYARWNRHFCGIY